MTDSWASDLPDRRALGGRGVGGLTNEARSEAAGSSGATGWLRRAVEEYCAGDLRAASECLKRAAERAPRSLLVPQLSTYLRSRRDLGGGTVYDEAEGFIRFIRGGGNVALYGALGKALGEVYRARRPRRVLDLGPGDGRAVFEALDAIGQDERPEFDLVEPAIGLLSDTAAVLDDLGVVHRDHPNDIREFLGDVRGEGRWELVQATFSVQSLAREARAAVLAALVGRCDRLVLAEFDVPARSEVLDPTWFDRCVQCMEQGLAEYSASDGDRNIVAQQFLVPMMLGFFHPELRTNHEQPVAAWVDELRVAGFSLARTPRLLHDYWWAPAYLLEAVPDPEA